MNWNEFLKSVLQEVIKWSVRYILLLLCLIITLSLFSIFKKTIYNTISLSDISITNTSQESSNPKNINAELKAIEDAIKILEKKTSN